MPALPKAAAALLGAMAVAFAAGAIAPDVAVAQSRPAAVDTALAARESRLVRRIQLGRMEGWLTRAEARERFGVLRRLKQREAEMRAANGGVLSDEAQAEIDRGLRDLAQDLRWTRERNHHAPRPQPH